MLKYILNLEKSWWLLFYGSIVLFIIFYYRYKFWCKENKKITIFLIISIGITIGNFLPSWNDSLVKYYELINDIALAYITGFIFYWFTCVEKENKILEMYYFNSLFILTKYLQILAFSYYKNKYKNIDDYSGDPIRSILVSIPLGKYKDFFPINNKLKEKILEQMDLELKAEQKSYNQCLENIKLQIASKKSKNTSRKKYMESYRSYKNQEIINLLLFFKNYYNFQNNNNFNYFTVSIDKINRFNRILNHIKKYTIEESELKSLEFNDLVKKYKNFIKNIPYIQKYIIEALEERIEYLSFYKIPLPTIELEFSIFYFSKRLTENTLAIIVLDLYKDINLPKTLVSLNKDTMEEEKSIISEIKKIDDKYYILTKENKIFNFKDIIQISLTVEEVQFIYQPFKG